MGSFDERTRPTKMQAAVLRAAQEASKLTKSTGTVEDRLLSEIVRHFFREPRVQGAIEQLRRMGYVSRGADGRFDLRVPGCAWNGILAGDDPEPLSDAQLCAIVARLGYAPQEVVAKPIPESIVEPIVELPKEPRRRKTKNAARRFVLLADHRLGESWYGDALPSPLSRAIIIANKACEEALLALRSKLTNEGMMEAFPEPTGRHVHRWRVTQTGIAYYERTGTEPSLTLDRVHAIATRLGFEPTSRSGLLGR